MKKLLQYILTIGLLCGVSFRVSYGGTISHTDYSAGAVITAAGQNTNENTIVNEFNGNIDNTNIKTGGILTGNIANATIVGGNINPHTNIAVDTVTVGAYMGQSTGTAACAGCIGEVISNVFASSNATTSNQWLDSTSILLTPGSWMIYSNIDASKSTATWSDVEYGISSTSGNSSSGLTLGDNYLVSSWANDNTTPTTVASSIVGYRIGVANTTRYYCKILVVYTGGPPSVNGRITALRTN